MQQSDRLADGYLQVYAARDDLGLFPFNFTHAGLDRSQFDQLEDQLAVAQRIAGRVGDGYVALFSASPDAAWATKSQNCSGGYGHCSPNVGREIMAST